MVDVPTRAEFNTLAARVSALEKQPAPPPRTLASILGVNCHIGWAGTPYANLPQTIAAIKYLGVRTVRDSCTDAATIALWKSVAAATGVKFANFMPEGSPALCQQALALVPQLAAAGLLAYVEGPNEPDDAYALSQGMTLAFAAQFQQQVFAAARAAKVPCINMSFGAGWSADNQWHGDYDKVGDLSAFCDFGNSHVYYVGNVAPGEAMQRVGDLALLAAKSRPVIVSETGYTTAQVPDENQRAGYMVAAAKAAFAAGYEGCYIYALFDDADAQSGPFGLFNSDGSPRLAATAIRNLAMGG